MCLLRSVFVVFLCFLLSSCGLRKIEENKDIAFNEDMVASSASVSAESIKSLAIYYSLDSYKAKKYEPDSCLLGAYILSDKVVGFDIAQFELKIAPHGSYKYHMKMGEEFPISWILSCYKENKLPFIALSPENNSSPYDYRLLTEYAKKFGELRVPIILGFYPNPIQNGYKPELYKSFFEYARGEFIAYAPNVAFAFVADSSEVYETDKYLPKTCVDWLGLDLYIPIENNRINNSYLASLNYFYEKYQSLYPLMISSFGVSNYSTTNHKYYIKNAKEEIKGFYTDLEEKYPRIKAVYYMDFDNSTATNFNVKPFLSDNFSITENEEIALEYKRVIQKAYFLNSFKEKNIKQEKILYKKMAVLENGKYYAPLSFLTDFGYSYAGLNIKKINNEGFVDAEEFSRLNKLEIKQEKNKLEFS